MLSPTKHFPLIFARDYTKFLAGFWLVFGWFFDYNVGWFFD